MDFIHPKIDEEAASSVKKVKVFCLNSKDDKLAYEALLNDEDVTIIEKHGPTFDKIGRAMIVLTWEQDL